MVRDGGVVSGSVTVGSDGQTAAMSTVSASGTASQSVASAHPGSSSSVELTPASCQASGGNKNEARAPGGHAGVHTPLARRSVLS